MCILQRLTPGCWWIQIRCPQHTGRHGLPCAGRKQNLQVPSSYVYHFFSFYSLCNILGQAVGMTWQWWPGIRPGTLSSPGNTFILITSTTLLSQCHYHCQYHLNLCFWSETLVTFHEAVSWLTSNFILYSTYTRNWNGLCSQAISVCHSLQLQWKVEHFLLM